jgi:hypothetical protein
VLPPYGEYIHRRRTADEANQKLVRPTIANASVSSSFVREFAPVPEQKSQQHLPGSDKIALRLTPRSDRMRIAS